jgi:probable F420-dependent oxidoreductase
MAVLDVLGRVGIWTRQLDEQHGTVAETAVAELERLGYRSVWIPEGIHREVISHATALLAATESIAIATGVARVHARAPYAAALAQRFLAERFPDRFVLGLGVSHPFVVERLLGQNFERPLATMREYLDAMDATRAGPATTIDAPRVLAALRPKMLVLAADRSAGAHTYLSPVEHTAWARGILGPGALLAPAIKVVLSADHDDPLAVARGALIPSLRVPTYATSLLGFGFDDADLAGDLSERLVRALVAIGDEDAVLRRVEEHLAAGADHVCVEVLTGDDTTVPLDAWRRLAPALTST